MRVIAGTAKGHRLRSSRGHSLRPTADRVKEALFNILPHDLSGLKVLDLFAGTANLTLEALSRGAREATLVDVSREAEKTIHKNLAALGFSKQSRVWIVPVQRALHLLARRGENFDLIFVDPPYEKGLVGRVLGAIAREGVLREAGFWWRSIVEKKKLKRATVLSIFTTSVDTGAPSSLFLVIRKSGFLSTARGKHGAS